jgi:hypothetical protein
MQTNARLWDKIVFMESDRESLIFRAHRKLVNASMSATRACYFIGCDKPTIRAHSISNKRLLLKLSKDGHVMHFNRDSSEWGSLVQTGRGAATTFQGMCGDHDKIFHPIDNEDYEVGNKQQEYLFAMRAAAKEFNTRNAMVHATHARVADNSQQEFPLSPAGLAMMDMFQPGFDLGLEDQKITRGVFVDTFTTSKYNVIDTAVIEVTEELPMAVSSTFNLETDYDGILINDLSPAGYSQRMKPCFFTVFPQGGKTYALISYLHRDRKAYGSLKNLNSLSETERKVIISNILTAYTENFTAEPDYWASLSDDTKSKYSTMYANSLDPGHRPLIADDTFSLFPSDQ